MIFEMLSAGTFFPIALKEHIIFGIVGVTFFVFQYCRLKKRYQALIAIAIATTFLLYMGDYMFVPVGIAEAFLMTAALVTLIQDSLKEKKKKAEEKTQEEAAKSAEENEVSAENADDDENSDAASKENTENGENE